MNQSTLLEKITELKYTGLKEAYLRQTEDVSYHTMSFDERLYQLLDAQDIFLKDKRINLSLIHI